MGSALALFGKRNGGIVTADKTLDASDTGKSFFTTGATAKVTFTLPAAGVSGGAFFRFWCGHIEGMVVAAKAVDTLITFNDTAADSLEVSSVNASIGALIDVESDGTNWYAAVLEGTRTVNT